MNWKTDYRSIYYLGDSTAVGSTAFAFRHDGRVLSFVEYNGAFYPQADISDRLTGSASTGWTYTSAAGDEVETYDTDGRLLSMRHRTMPIAGRGRIAIPDAFREFLGVEPGGEVLVVGAAVCVEIWRPESWSQHIGDQMPGFKQLFDQLTE